MNNASKQMSWKEKTVSTDAPDLADLKAMQTQTTRIPSEQEGEQNACHDPNEVLRLPSL